VGLVGESGSGKSTLTRVLVGLQQPTAGTVELAGAPPVPGQGRAQLVFQDPTAALDRRQTVGGALTEALDLARRRGVPVGDDEVARLLTRVGLEPVHAARRPWQLSGGQRQRVVIARALAARPDVLVLDEPVSSLDAVVRAGVLELLRSLRADGVALLVVSHDLAAVEALADEVVVLDRGAVVESGPTAQVLRSPQHPVTAALVAAAHPMTARPTTPEPGAAIPAARPRERTTP
jgi:peptide/nickel transport system ATP-binding protein